ncbi:hypothetical protein [Amycolatopsis sp. WGS_07]|uniref:hypothetical protein n=1 Tax=Amycolatopsis sp. WGS_07 TaxID=3076764 RepID=UPI003872B53A
MEVNSAVRGVFFCVAYIYCEAEDGAKSVGTGHVQIEQVDDLVVPVLITNRHVIAGAKRGKIRFIRSNGDGGPLLGESVEYVYEEFQEGWICHPDPEVDVAAKLLLIDFLGDFDGEIKPFFKAVSGSVYPTEEVLQELDILQELCFVGYPSGLYDSKNLTPVFRRAVAATPIEVDWQGKPVFLIDGSIVNGSSGSPIFVIEEGMYRQRNGSLMIGASRVVFLGIISSVYEDVGVGKMATGSAISEFRVNQRINLALVYKWTAVREAVRALISSQGREINVVASAVRRNG